MSGDPPGSLRVETKTPSAAVHVAPAGQEVQLGIGEPSDAAARSTTLSLPQAEMLLHALGWAVAEVRERQRVQAEEQARLAEGVLDQEFRRG